mgnify:CR=1 FL=1
MRGYQEAGLPESFDGLADIVASIKPPLAALDGIAGHSGGSRFTRLQGDVIFNVWREHDELPSWNAGLAKLSYDPSGRLLWARRYPAPDKKHDLVEDKSKQFSFPVVYSWSERARLGNGLAGPDSGVAGQPAAPAQSGAALPVAPGQTAPAGAANGGRP